MVLDEQRYWEQFIAFVVLVFTIYPIVRDYLQPASPPIDNKAFTLCAVTYAMIASIIIFVVGYCYLKYLKRKEEREN